MPRETSADPYSIAVLSAVISGAVQSLCDKIFRKLFTYKCYKLLGRDDKALAILEDKLISLRRMLRDNELKIFKNKETRDWYGNVRRAVNEADIILEDPQDLDSDERHQQRVCNPFPTLFKFSGVCYPFSTLFKFSDRKRNKIGKRIASLLRKIDGLEVQRDLLNFDEIDLTPNCETLSTLSEVVFGRNNDKEIVKFLLSGEKNQSDNGPLTYAIVGLAGIGKTTLAQLILKDERVAKNFDSITWVWVSKTFDVKKVMEKIIETKTGEAPKYESLETTQNHLKKLLSGEKFLLVLDDMWDKDVDQWNKLKSPLNFGAIGSSILLTTRGADVASTFLAHNQHRITFLSEDQCWHVFKESAFLEGNRTNRMLEVIGKQISKKCGGLPLVAKSLGVSLRFSREVHVWESTRDSNIWELPELCDILPALKLSVDSLGIHARDCFAFCSVFPKGYQMTKKELIQLWMANELIPPHPILEPEDLGNQIFNELVLKSVFEISPDNGDVKMPDLMHDLAFFIYNKGFCWEEDTDLSKIPTAVSYLSWYPSRTYNQKTINTLSELLPFLHTWILNDRSCRDFPREINFKNLNRLRALDLKWNRLHDLPKSIGKIKHLKYLRVSGCTDVTYLPFSICCLTNLQTVILKDLPELTQLSRYISEFVHLRNLDLSYCGKLIHLPDELSQLDSLRSLHIESCPALLSLPVMRNSIVEVNIHECQSLKSLSESLQYLSSLETLRVNSCVELSSEDFQGLISLRTLSICGLPKLTSLPCLQHLSTLEIRLRLHDNNDQPALESLSINNCEQLELTGADFQHLVKLQSISLCDLPRLASLPELHHLQSLKTFEVRNCKKLSVLPQGMQDLTSLEELCIVRCHRDLHSGCNKETGEYWPSIKHIPNLLIELPCEEAPRTSS